jgi:hypothetical protein
VQMATRWIVAKRNLQSTFTESPTELSLFTTRWCSKRCAHRPSSAMMIVDARGQELMRSGAGMQKTVKTFSKGGGACLDIYQPISSAVPVT